MTTQNDITGFDRDVATYYHATIKNIDTKIKTGDSLTEADKTIISDYYEYLDHAGIIYGKAAGDIVNNQGSFGILGNRYFELYLTDEGYDAASIAGYKDQFMVDLALRDSSLRLGTNNGIINYDTIKDYHLDSLDDLHLPRTAWGGAFLDVFGGAGTSMDLGDFDISIDINQSAIAWALLTNETKDGVNVWEAANALSNAFSDELNHGLSAILDRINHNSSNSFIKDIRILQELNNMEVGDVGYFQSHIPESEGGFLIKNSDGTLTPIELPDYPIYDPNEDSIYASLSFKYNTNENGEYLVDSLSGDRFLTIDQEPEIISLMLTKLSIEDKVNINLENSLISTYTVKSQDSISNIAISLGLTIGELMTTNSWLETNGRISSNGDMVLIKAGEVLLLPQDKKDLAWLKYETDADGNIIYTNQSDENGNSTLDVIVKNIFTLLSESYSEIQIRAAQLELAGEVATEFIEYAKYILDEGNKYCVANEHISENTESAIARLLTIGQSRPTDPLILDLDGDGIFWQDLNGNKKLDIKIAEVTNWNQVRF